jgi:hypothetical protein
MHVTAGPVRPDRGQLTASRNLHDSRAKSERGSVDRMNIKQSAPSFETARTLRERITQSPYKPRLLEECQKRVNDFGLRHE